MASSPASHSTLDYALLYKKACADANCRTNSAVLKTLSEHPTAALLHLNLANNYIGPKGFGPLLSLIERCQSIRRIDLSGNGLDNACVDRLCDVLKHHLGICTLILSDNPITNDAGKPLMALLDANKRVVAIELERVDVFAALVERIYRAAEDNNVNGGPTVNEGGVAVNGGSVADGGIGGNSATSPKEGDSVLNCLQNHAVRTSVKPIGSPKAVRVPLGVATSSRFTVKSAASNEAGGGLSPAPPALTPKPPAPALAANDNARLSNTQQAAMRAKYKQRRDQYKQADRSEASRAAETARYQLMMLEAADQRSEELMARVAAEAEAERIAEAAARTAAAITDGREGDGSDSGLRSDTSRTPPAERSVPNLSPEALSFANDTNSNQQQRTGAQQLQPHAPSSAPSGSSNSNSISTNLRVQPPPGGARKKRASFSEAPPEEHTYDPDLEAANVGHSNHAAAAAAASASAAANATNTYNGPAITHTAEGQTVVYSKDASVAPFTVPPTKEERFKQLFDEGCDAYKRRDVDVAFLKWNDAAAFAQEHRNREWIAIVTSNLQRLSYEMLVAEGNKNLEEGRLDEAEKNFAFATDVALKAKNSQWEADMAKSRKNVQYAVFQREQDRSTMLFETAVRAADEELSAEDVFLGPDGVRIVTHTSAFHNEWRRMLPIKEALEGWVNASKVASKISGPSARVLLDIVSSSILNVTQYFIKTFFAEAINTDANILPQQGTVRYRYDEADALRKLWEELLYDTQSSLNCPPFQAVGRCHIGHLCISLNMLSDAASHFRAAIQIAEAAEDASLAAIANTYLAMVYYQRSHFEEAEKTLGRSLSLWDAIANHRTSGTSGGAKPSTPAGATAGAGPKTDASSNNLLGGGGTSPTPDDLMTAPDDGSPITVKSQALPNSRLVQKGPLVPVGEGGASDDANGGAATTSADGTTADPLLTNVGPGLRTSPFYRYVPQEVHRFLEAHCYHLLVNILICRSRHNAALEVLELSLQRKHTDALATKVKSNFAAKPTLDHIAAVATGAKSMHVYLKTTNRFEWNVDVCQYDSLEQLHSWCVPECGEISFTTVHVTDAHKVPSISALVKEVRSALYVSPLTAAAGGEGNTDAVDGGMRLEMPPAGAWIAPLQTLYAIIVEPLLSFIQSHNAYDPNRVLTIVPCDQLWSVPFGALLDASGESYFIEQIALQLSFSGIYTTFASLNSLQAKQRDSAKVVLVTSPAADVTDADAACRKYGLVFPLDKQRAEEEVHLISDAIAAGLAMEEQTISAFAGESPNVAAAKKAARSTIGGNADYVSQSLRSKYQSMKEADEAEEAVAADKATTTGAVENAESTTPTNPHLVHDGSPTAPHTEATLSSNVFRNAQLTRHHRYVEDIESVKAELLGARFVHIAAPGVSSVTSGAEGSAGGICLSGEYGAELSLLHNSELSRMALFAQLVSMSNTTMNPSLLCGPKEGTICSLRALLAAGCPSIVAGMWCTPDMFPAELFQRLYLLHLEPQPTKLTELKPAGPRSSVIGRTSSFTSGGGYGTTNGSSFSAGITGRNSINNPPPTGTLLASATSVASPHIIKRRNKALAFAMAVRAMLSDPTSPIDYRTAPHHWAGYFLVGVGE